MQESQRACEHTHRTLYDQEFLLINFGRSTSVRWVLSRYASVNEPPAPVPSAKEFFTVIQAQGMSLEEFAPEWYTDTGGFGYEAKNISFNRQSGETGCGRSWNIRRGGDGHKYVQEFDKRSHPANYSLREGNGTVKASNPFEMAAAFLHQEDFRCCGLLRGASPRKFGTVSVRQFYYGWIS